MNITRRFLSTNSNLKKLAVIGSGPSSFYTILQILKKQPNNFQIDIFEKNPSPFGLVRYGVAPDHPEVKNCIDKFNEIGEFIKTGKVKYFGNVEICKDLSLNDLYKNYNGILYAYGSSNGNKVEFPGSLHQNIINSFDFVNWYNGNHNYKNVIKSLKGIKDISIIGAGNVAIDIIRILLGDVNKRWKSTDISNHALNILKESDVKNVNVIIRRGILDSKFTNKELRELLEMRDEGVEFKGWNKEDFDEQLKSLGKLDRVNKRRIDLLNKYKENGNGNGNKGWKLNYLRSPIGIMVKPDGNIKELLVKVSKMVHNEENDKWEYKSDGKIESIPSDLVILATGYKCEPLNEFKEIGIPFENGKIINNNGKIENIKNSYCVGWVSNNSQGNINNTVNDSMNVAETIINDEELINDENKEGREEIEIILKDKKHKIVKWEDWEKIHSIEIDQGNKDGKPYNKLSFNEMLELVK